MAFLEYKGKMINLDNIIAVELEKSVRDETFTINFVNTYGGGDRIYFFFKTREEANKVYIQIMNLVKADKIE